LADADAFQKDYGRNLSSVLMSANHGKITKFNAIFRFDRTNPLVYFNPLL